MLFVMFFVKYSPVVALEITREEHIFLLRKYDKVTKKMFINHSVQNEI